MDLFSSTAHLPVRARGAVAALGNFDGVHKGHQAVLNAARALAKAEGRPFGVITFEPHPRSVFFPGQPPFRITPAAIKRDVLKEMGVDVLFEIPFSMEFAAIPAEEFMQRILLDELSLTHAVAGHDFVFGHKRAGSMESLKAFFGQHERSVTEMSPQRDAAAQLWSSTRIREQLQNGTLDEAAAALGRGWEIEGVVVRGDGAGRGLGYPTANISLDDYVRPRHGVYAVRVKRGGKTCKGVANIGMRPTMAGRDERFETHLFDFAGDLYGQHLRVELVAFLRPERAFNGLEALKAQIAQDCLAAARCLA